MVSQAALPARFDGVRVCKLTMEPNACIGVVERCELSARRKRRPGVGSGSPHSGVHVKGVDTKSGWERELPWGLQQWARRTRDNVSANSDDRERERREATGESLH